MIYSDVRTPLNKNAITPIKIKSIFSYNASTQKFKYTFNIDAPANINKPKLNVTFYVLKSETENGSYREIARLPVKNISYLRDYPIEFTRGTGYYKVKVELQSLSQGANVISPVYGSVQLFNRTGKAWNFNYVDKVSGKSLPKPPANYSKNQIHKRPSDLNKQYKTWYDGRYNVNLNLTGYEVHHIRPLAYGGDNSMGNLIHLNKSYHSNVTAWWSGY